jgi:hypothetical protein
MFVTAASSSASNSETGYKGHDFCTKVTSGLNVETAQPLSECRIAAEDQPRRVELRAPLAGELGVHAKKIDMGCGPC